MPAALRPFKADREKILESVVYLINQRNDLSQWDILKAIFIADKYHLNKYGRPVTFDNYVAMELGPVGSLTYDILKPTAKWHNYYKEERPWVTLPRGKQNIFVEVKRQHKKDVLSETDVAALNSGLDMVLTLSFTQLKRLTHDDPAYKEAWKRRGIAKAADMDMQRLLDEQDDETIERLAYVTRS